MCIPRRSRLRNMQLRQRSCRWCFRAKRTQRHYRLYRVALQREDHRRNWPGENGHKKGHKTVPFWVLDDFAKINASALERMAGTTGLEPAASAVTDRTRIWRVAVFRSV